MKKTQQNTKPFKSKISIDEYLNGRFKEQYDYYNERSKYFQRRYKFFAVSNLILTASIPVLSISSDSNLTIKYSIAIAGALATVCSGIPLISKYRDSWVKFRLTAEALNSEKAKFTTRSDNYIRMNDEECNNYFVSQCEKYMSDEHEEWLSIIHKDK
jgi:hypothetical protein